MQEADHEAASHEHDFWVAKRAVELLWGMRGNESTGHLRYSGSAQPTDAAAFDRSQTPNLNWSTPCCLEGAAVTRKKAQANHFGLPLSQTTPRPSHHVQYEGRPLATGRKWEKSFELGLKWTKHPWPVSKSLTGVRFGGPLIVGFAAHTCIEGRSETSATEF